jgi:hypothetical protein
LIRTQENGTLEIKMIGSSREVIIRANSTFDTDLLHAIIKMVANSEMAVNIPKLWVSMSSPREHPRPIKLEAAGLF